MANEVTANIDIEYSDGLTALGLQISGRTFNSAGKRVIRNVQSILTSETVIDLGGITNVGAWCIVNLDPTNFVNLKVAASGAIRDKLAADTAGTGKGGFAAGTCMGSGSQVPVAIADTAPCKVAVLIVEL